MSGLDVGVLAPHTGRAAGPDALTDVAEAAEELGFASLWVGDHVLLPGEQRSAYPYAGADDDDSYEVPPDRPFLEAFCTLSYLAAHTTRCALGLSVGILPYRHPALWAKLIGTTSQLADGRLIFGAGTGWMAEEFSALGVELASRGARTDETLAFLRYAWAQQGPISFTGEHVRMASMHVNPGAGERTPPPVWVGGNGTPALRRTARFGDVWHPHVRGTPPQRVADGLAEVRELAADNGRGERSFPAALHAPVQLADTVAGDPWELGRFEGPAQFVADQLEQYRDAGLAHAVLTFGGSPTSRIRLMERLAAALRLNETGPA